MNYDQKFWLSFWAIMGTITIIAVICASTAYSQSWRYLTENGYEEQLVPGSNRSIWVKAKQ